MSKTGRHPKHEYWLAQFREGVPVFLACRFVESRGFHIEERCQREGIDAFLRYAGGTYGKDKLGEWAAKTLGFTQEIMDDLTNGGGINRDLLTMFPAASGMNTIEYRLAQSLSEFIPTTKWWKENIKYVRSECSKHNIVKGIMES